MIRNLPVLLAVMLAGTTMPGRSQTPAASLSEAASSMVETLRLKGLNVDAEAATPGMMEAIARSIDPQSRIMTAADLEASDARRAGRVTDLGMRISLTNGYPVVIKVEPSSPAAEAGIETGNLLAAVGKRPTVNLPLGEVLDLLRDPDATSVVVRIVAGDPPATNRFELAPAVLPVPSIETAETLPSGIGYIRMNGLFEDAGRELIPLVRGWEQTGATGFILDLRDAGGANILALERIGSLFVPSGGLLFSFRDVDDQDISVHEAGEGGSLSIPAMVLIDEGTRDAAEALAAALAYAARVLLIGSETAGDALVREIIELPGGYLLRIATRKLVTATGTVYDGSRGVPADITLADDATIANLYDPELSPDRRELIPEEFEDLALRQRLRGDAALIRAVDILLGIEALDLSGSPEN